MTCIFCNGKTEEGLVTHMIDIQGHITIVRGMPVDICTQCGEYFIDDETMEKLEVVKNNIRKKLDEPELVVEIQFKDIA